ncbi:LytTR family DNA-binding domain-containing protein [Pseudoalteromonas luteoviolacea]|uniref:LytTR family DNA-binding domain-containing protein n=1 Tax=Pseudoalteromonas luteoviolacea TaxID=43657 RepID=UPI001B37714D|nr:LytTR family DNA-binding domain-containing protein [Pseudoalteromonas luteoviolacea]MBQ4840126.1 LytTR family transcriptional regulator [Pseudoalteromonas luteoviolacea]
MANRENDKNIQSNQSLIKSWMLRDFFSDCAVVFVFATFLAYLKPFGMDSVSFVYALGFWLTMCFCGYALYAPAIRVGDRVFDAYLPIWARHKLITLALSTFLASLVMGLIAPFIISAFFSMPSGYWGSVVSSIIASVFIGGIITAASAVKTYVKLQRQVIIEQQAKIDTEQAQVGELKERNSIEFINKLPIEKRGSLLCLQMDDHYLKVITDKGEHLLLMRFKDALLQLHEFPGFQTHRSWWVAKEAVDSTKKDGRKLVLILSNGLEVPVSQTYMRTAKAQLNLL